MEKFGQEWVSAAVDGETDSQAIAELASDKASHEKWRNYHMIGDAMRGELPQTLNLDLSARIADAIEQEPTIMAPTPSREEATEQQVAAKVSGDSVKVVPFYKQFGQYAIAATVAVMAIVGVQNMNQTAGDTDITSPALVTRPLIGSASPVSYQGPGVQQGYTNEQLREQQQRVNSYLQDHLLQQRLNAGAVVDNNMKEAPAPANQ